MLQVAIYARPMPGELKSGDQGGFWWLSDSRLLVCLCDGLGHGVAAYHAAIRCLELVSELRTHPLEDILSYCNDRLRSSRGVAMALALIDSSKQQLQFISVGNITAQLMDKNILRKFRAIPGIVGNENHLNLSCENIDFLPAQHCLLLWSDGLTNGVPLSPYVNKTLYPNLNHLTEQLVEEKGSANDDASLAMIR